MVAENQFGSLCFRVLVISSSGVFLSSAHFPRLFCWLHFRFIGFVFFFFLIKASPLVAG